MRRLVLGTVGARALLLATAGVAAPAGGGQPARAGAQRPSAPRYDRYAVWRKAFEQFPGYELVPDPRQAEFGYQALVRRFRRRADGAAVEFSVTQEHDPRLGQRRLDQLRAEGGRCQNSAFFGEPLGEVVLASAPPRRGVVVLGMTSGPWVVEARWKGGRPNASPLQKELLLIEGAFRQGVSNERVDRIYPGAGPTGHDQKFDLRIGGAVCKDLYQGYGTWWCPVVPILRLAGLRPIVTKDLNAVRAYRGDKLAGTFIAAAPGWRLDGRWVPIDRRYGILWSKDGELYVPFKELAPALGLLIYYVGPPEDKPGIRIARLDDPRPRGWIFGTAPPGVTQMQLWRDDARRKRR